MQGTILDRVNDVIRIKGYKQCAVAVRAGFSPKEFNDLIKGRKTFKAEYVKPICTALDVSPNVLFGFEDITS